MLYLLIRRVMGGWRAGTEHQKGPLECLGNRNTELEGRVHLLAPNFVSVRCGGNFGGRGIAATAGACVDGMDPGIGDWNWTDRAREWGNDGCGGRLAEWLVCIYDRRRIGGREARTSEGRETGKSGISVAELGVESET